MAKPSVSDDEPLIYAATLGNGGKVHRLEAITLDEAIIRRRTGEDVVVCGNSLTANRRLAKQIEQQANGAYIIHEPHLNAGPHALPHCQPSQRPPEGHTFYETIKRKAF